MNHSQSLGLLGLSVLVLALLVPAAGLAANTPAPIRLTVDATEAPRRIFHARLVFPASPGPLTLLYPKWIPGEHGPTGPIADLAGLKLSAAGKPIPWRRDDVDMYAFLVDVPAGASTVEAELDFLSPPVTEGFSSGASATAQLAVLSWNQLLLYPAGLPAEELTYAATVRLPAGWKFGTALPVATQSGGTVEFEPVTLTRLVDSPLLAGAYFRKIPLSPGGTPEHHINIAADSEAALEITPDYLSSVKRLVAETGALFGARHYQHYDFLLTLSDHVARFGLEHHESSDNRSFERSLVDEDKRRLVSGLLPHEFVHSWCGKHRRPAGLATPDFQQPMKGELLWVYEGLTTYLGDVLTGRSGFWSPELCRENLALDAAAMEHRVGRTWRPLADTAIAAQRLYEARKDWANWRRGTDFYPESALIWLEADVTIRKKTHGTRSLDDFCRRFFGGEGGAPTVIPYGFDDVVRTMNEVVPHDWRTFFRSRLDAIGPAAPLGGIEEAGWRLSYTDVLPVLLKSTEEVRKIVDLSSSLGIVLKEDGTIDDVVPGLPAATAGLAPGMKLIAVGGRKWSKEIVRSAITAAKTAATPLDLLFENGEFYKSYSVDYHGGERYPQLERDSTRPDLLTGILGPLAPPAPAPTAPGG